MDQPTSKACTKCREVKSLERFSPNAGSRGGYRPACRDCRRKPRKTPQRLLSATHKECSGCKLMIPHSGFSVSTFGLVSLCRKCRYVHVLAWQRANPALHTMRVRAWQRENPETTRAHRRASSSRRRARKSSAPTSPFTPAQQAQRADALGNRCWMCGTPEWSHWDHVKPLSKGGAHCLANLRPACASCNLRKSAKWEGAQWAHDLRFRNLLASY